MMSIKINHDMSLGELMDIIKDHWNERHIVKIYNNSLIQKCRNWGFRLEKIGCRADSRSVNTIQWYTSSRLIIDNLVNEKLKVMGVSKIIGAYVQDYNKKNISRRICDLKRSRFLRFSGLLRQSINFLSDSDIEDEI